MRFNTISFGISGKANEIFPAEVSQHFLTKEREEQKKLVFRPEHFEYQGDVIKK